MRLLLLDDCRGEGRLEMDDPDRAAEVEFEATVAQALMCAYPKYECLVFNGGFRHHGEVSKPDLALVAKDFSHWFVIEVELTSHSLEGHVLPQIRRLVYGDPEPDCETILSREMGIEKGQAATIVKRVPYRVAVVANKANDEWKRSLAALEAQMLSVLAFRSASGKRVLEVEGSLDLTESSIGFAEYSATDRALRLLASAALDTGQVQIYDSNGGASLWTVTEVNGRKWMSKNVGTPDLVHGSRAQLIRSRDGRIILRRLP